MIRRVITLTACFVISASLSSVCFGDKTDKPKNKRPVRIANGSAATELNVAAWNDGKERQLSDFRGKVVVLHFWGSWCVPCADKIPLWQRLRLKYPKDEVVFLGIHTAGTELEAVKEYMKKLKWEQVTAIDEGASIPESSTFRKYGISAVDQIVVITRTGLVHCNGTSKYMEGSSPFEMEEKLGLKKASSKEEQLENGMAILEYVYSNEIDDALKQKSPPVKQRGTTQAAVEQAK